MTVGHAFQAIMTALPDKRDEVIALPLDAPSLPHPQYLDQVPVGAKAVF
ncbi:hypothetical protein [Actinoplanes sp. NBRC 103695]|nr:hypothetical protein [Actinoplanes sp. NBRC 103695]